MIEFKDGITVGQIVDQIADDYFAQGADALTAYTMALRDVSLAFTSFAKNAVEMVSHLFGGFLDQEVTGDA